VFLQAVHHAVWLAWIPRALPPTAAGAGFRDAVAGGVRRDVCDRAVRVVLPRARVSIVLAALIAAHPRVWVAVTVLPGAVIVRLSAVELATTFVEAAIYARCFGLRMRVALALSAAANAASLLALPWL
jgi:hypothetical protein